MTESMEHAYARRKGLYPGGTADDYEHVFHGIPTKEQRTCRNCGLTAWFDTSVSDRWPHYECGAGEGFSKDSALADVPEQDYYEIEPKSTEDVHIEANATVRL